MILHLSLLNSLIRSLNAKNGLELDDQATAAICPPGEFNLQMDNSMDTEEDNTCSVSSNPVGDRVSNEDVRPIRRTRNQIRRFSPPLAPPNELGKKKRNTRSHEKSITPSPSQTPITSGRRSRLCSSNNLISPPDSQVASESYADLRSDSGNLVDSHDDTNAITLFTPPVSQIVKDERVDNVDSRQTRRTRNQIRRYSPPPAPQNDSNRMKRSTRSHEKSVTPSPCHTPIIPSPCQTPTPSARSTRSARSGSRLSNSSERNTGSLRRRDEEMDHSSGRTSSKRHMNTKDFVYDDDLFVVPSLSMSQSISSSLNSSHIDENESMNSSIDDGESICLGDSESELLDDDERRKNQGKKQAARRRSKMLADSDSDWEQRSKRRENCREYQRRRRSDGAKKKKDEVLCNTPSTSKGSRVDIPATPTTALSNDLMNSLNFDIEEDEDQTKSKKVFYFPGSNRTPIRPRPTTGRDPDMKLEDWLALRKRDRHNLVSVQSSDNVPDSEDSVGSRVVNETEGAVDVDIMPNDDGVVRSAILPEDIPVMSAYRASREQRRIQRQATQPTLNKQKSRIMPPHTKNFANPVYAVPKQCDLGDRQTCPHCRALTYTFNCCADGRVKIPPPRPPPNYLRKLLIGKGPEAKHFRAQIVKYNTAFSMSSNRYERKKTKASQPFIKINGMIHHQLAGSILPPGKKVPLFHQLYKYDISDATKYRMMNPVTGNSVMPNILRNVQMILEDVNFHVKQYKTAVELIGDMIKVKKPMRNLFVVLRAPSEAQYQGTYDPRTLARPRQELQSILYSTEPDGGPGKHGLYIVHRQFGGRMDVIGYWNPLADPLSYPMLFPYGNSGYKRGEYKLDEDYIVGKKEISDDEDIADCYPFEDLHDEMEMGVEMVDYNVARLKYKAYRKEMGEDVSSSEEEADSEEEEKEHEVEENENPDDSANVEMEEIQSDNEEPNPHFIFADSSAEEGEPVNEDGFVRVNNTEEDVQVIDANDAKEKWRIELREKEREIREKMLRRERILIIRNEKIRKFKDVCFKEREEIGFLAQFFKDSSELRQVSIDLHFIEYKRCRQRDTLYWLSGLLLGMNRTTTYEIFKEDFEGLQRAIDYEITEISSNPNYRSDEPVIKKFRNEHLVPSKLDDNAGSDYEDPNDLIQHDVTEPYPDNAKSKKGTKRPYKPVQCPKGRRVFVSRKQHALHQMQIRDSQFHPYLSTMLLGQLYVIDLALRIVRQRNDNIRDHMIRLRGTHENSLSFMKHARSANKKGFDLGYAFELTNARPGSTAWYKEMFENAMAIMDFCGKPDLFITMTGDPNWDEIKKNKLPDSEWHSNPFLVNDVFHMKMQELLNDVIEKELFGPVVSYCYSVEFQKRGMPHMHLLVTLKDGHKLDTSDKVDQHIKATIPPEPQIGEEDYDLKMRYRNNVINHMVHSACGGDYKGSYCHVREGPSANRVFKRCTKNYPFPLNTHTSTIDGGKVIYHRPDDRVTCKKTVNRKEVELGNEYVVPYNPFLLNKYACHVNVEAVTTVDVVKYIYKYIYKGFDKALAQFIEASEVDDGDGGQPPPTVVHKKKNDTGAILAPYGVKGTSRQWSEMIERTGYEMKKRNIESNGGKPLVAYDEAIMTEVFRQMTASEAAWIIQGYFMAGLSHNVVNLSVHEEGKMPVFFREGEQDKMKQRVDDGTYMSMFAAWFKLNAKDKNARKYTYDQIPLHYTFEKDTTKCEWRPYKVNMEKRNIIRVRPVSPRFLETFSIRLLAMNTKGPQSFEELRTVGGRVFETFHEAAKAKGLMDSQLEFDVCLEEAIDFTFPYQLRRLFATMLVFGGVTDPAHLWEKYEKAFYERSLERTPDKARNAALFHLQILLSEHGLTLAEFNLPGYDDSFVMTSGEYDQVVHGGHTMDVRDHEEEANKMEQSLNSDQKKAFKTIMDAVESNGKGRDGNCFFLQGSGGCGKTYVYRTIYHKLQTNNPPIPVIMIATTGIAATLLIKGTTAHRKFMLPLNADANATSSMKLESEPAEELRQTTVVIIDESTMASKFLFNAIDKLFQDLMKNDRPFGGKIILLGGDWKQLLPVVPGSSSSEAMFHTLKIDALWKNFKVLSLSKNMRAQKDPEYSTLLENIGNGLVNGVEDDNVLLEPKCIVQKVDDVIDFIYGDMESEPDKVASSCILSSLNKETCEINEKVLDMLPGVMKTYKAIDTPREGIGMQVPPEYFRQEMPSGLPPYELNLKEGAVVILLRNLCVSKGLCNGSRLRVLKMHKHSILCELLTTDFAGSKVVISKLSVEPPSKGKKNAHFSRFQIPIRLAYAMTINKAQGQTFDRVGIILKNNVFSHGQLYVALSRARESDNVRLYSASRMSVDGRNVVAIRNRVERDILEPIPVGSLIDPNYVSPGYVDAEDEVQVGLIRVLFVHEMPLSRVSMWASTPLYCDWVSEPQFVPPVECRLARHTAALVQRVKMNEVVILEAGKGTGKSTIAPSIAYIACDQVFNENRPLISNHTEAGPGFRALHITATGKEAMKISKYLEEKMRSACEIVVGCMCSELIYDARNTTTVMNGFTNYLVCTEFYGLQALIPGVMFDVVVLDDIYQNTSTVQYLLHVIREGLKNGTIFRVIVLCEAMSLELQTKIVEHFNEIDVDVEIVKCKSSSSTVEGIEALTKNLEHISM